MSTTTTPTAPLMLGVSGLRGIAGQSLTPEVAARYAAAFGAWLRDSAPRTRTTSKARRRPLVYLGRDGRAGGHAIVSAAAAGLAASGCDATIAGVMMSPTMGTLVDMAGAAAGMMATASHNPQEWNGLKIILRDPGVASRAVSAAAPSKPVADAIVARFRAAEPPYAPRWQDIGDIDTGADVSPDIAHITRVNAALDELDLRPAIAGAKFRVALDCVGASGAVATPLYLASLRAKPHVEGHLTDGIFTHTPEPIRENLRGLTRLVKAHRAAVGFAQDPDADRLAIVDETGRYIGEEYTLVLAAEAVLMDRGGTASRHQGLKGTRTKGTRATGERAGSSARAARHVVLVTNLSTSRMLDDVAARHGARVVRTAVGEANVVETMKRLAAEGHDVAMGGEGNGGVIWPKVTYIRDSLSAMALVLSLIARRKQPLSAIVDAMPCYAIEKRKVEIRSKDDAQPAVERLAAAHAGQRLDRQDGIRIDWPDRRAWLHVRASNTEPIMRLIAEAPTPREAKAILDDAARIAASR